MKDEPYQCQQTVADGPSGRVFRGVETATGRWVRFKVLHDPACCPSPLSLETLTSCLPPLLSWRHPRVASLLALCPAEETPVLVHEWCAGCDGWLLPQRQRVAAVDLRALSWQLIEVLTAAQQHGFCHGALHPGNLGVCGLPGAMQLLVRDWGLAQARRVCVPGAMACWSPPRLQGGGISISDDLFAAGCCLHYLACAALPIAAAAPEPLKGACRLQLHRCTALGSLRPDLDGQWLQWLARLLEAPKDGGFASPQEALQAWPSDSAPRPATPGSQPAGPQRTGHVSRARGLQPAGKVRPLPPGSNVWPRLLWLGLGGCVLAATLRVGGAGWHQHFWRWLREHAQSSPSQTLGKPLPRPSGLDCLELCVAMSGRATLQLAEVEAWGGGRNLAGLGQAWQSSTYRGAEASRAIDGKRGEGVNEHSQTQGADKDPQWRLTWPRPQRIERLVIWNRRDQTASRLSNFTLSLRDEHGQLLWSRTITDPPMPMLELVLDASALGATGNP
jgi:hypothetical protein